MTELDLTTLANKVDRMTERLERLTRYRQYALEEYLADEDTQIIVERLLELVIQSALDINRTLLKRVAGKSVESNYDSFIEMGNSSFISMDLARELAPSGSFRNILAHEYDEIIPEEVYRALSKVFEQYSLYLESIQNYLDSLEVDDES